MYSNADVADKFTAPNSSNIGNQKLTYPVALMTADEVSFAGGLSGADAPNTYYYLNSTNGSSTGTTWWWTMSPYGFGSSSARVFRVGSYSGPDYLGKLGVNGTRVVRPVLSLKSCVQVTSGNGTSGSPYEVSVSDSCAALDN